MSTDSRLDELLAQRRVLVADGGMGTMLFDSGLTSGESPEPWNVSKPDVVGAIHRAYAEAGADIILTNTFGGNARRLRLHALDDRVEELNIAAVDVARRSTSDIGRTVLVAGSIGPSGDLMNPLGPLSYDEAREVFDEQAAALAEGGADILWIETMSSLEELSAAADAAAATGVPYVTTMSFDTRGATMMGVLPAQLREWARVRPEPPLAIGANCGIGPSDNVASVRDMRGDATEALTVAKANCGVPFFKGIKAHYPVDPDRMGRYAELAVDAGASIVGSCCGSTPQHIKVVAHALSDYQASSPPSDSDIESALGDAVHRPVERATRVRRRSTV